MFVPYESVSFPGPFAFDAKIPYVACGFFGLKNVVVADRYEPYQLVMPILPLPSPPFHQIWLPSPRKLQAVRFSIQTPFAFSTSMPFPSSPRLKFWSFAFELQAGPDSVPSTITPVRDIPRRCRRSVLIRTFSL